MLSILTGTVLAEQHELYNETTLPFTDVTEDDWFYSSVNFVHENGIMIGTSPTTFGPRAPFSRAMVVATLFRFYHGRQANAFDSRTDRFNDVPTDRWFSPYVTWAYANGIVNGIGDDRFAPLDNVDRQQLATMIFRFADKMLEDFDTNIRQGPGWEDFSDRNQIAPWAQDALTWANYHGLVTGRTETTLAPRNTANRAEAATILMRFINTYRHYSNLARIDVSSLLRTNFNNARHLFGNEVDRVYDMQFVFYSFDTGIVVGVSDGTAGVTDGIIVAIGISFRNFEGMRSRMHFGEINGTFMRADVREALGAPDYYEHSYISQQHGERGLFYTYFLINPDIQNDTAIQFIFDTNDRMVGMFFTTGVGLT